MWNFRFLHAATLPWPFLSMFRLCYALLGALLLTLPAEAQPDPLITTWQLNTTGTTGYNNQAADVQRVQYSAGSVYVSCSAIPAYTIGPWPGQPTQGPVAQNFTFRFTRTPQPNTGTPTVVPGGHIGCWKNGVSVFNAQDATSYNNQGVWFQNAVVVEGRGFDACNGHPTPQEEYHNHVNPRCVYDDRDSTRHAPIIGYAFDGYPIYGTYGYASATAGSGRIKSMKSSFRLRPITLRTTRPGSTVVLPANQQGPAVSTRYPLGYYIYDYEYVAGLGDLDEHNGRWCVTPEYPQGTYSYFVTLNSFYEGVYPYTLGTSFYGVVPNYGNIGPNSGHVSINESVTSYLGPLATRRAAAGLTLSCAPNPASTTLTFTYTDTQRRALRAWLVSPLGQAVTPPVTVQATTPHTLELGHLPAGVYFLWLEGDGVATSEKVVVTR